MGKIYSAQSNVVTATKLTPSKLYLKSINDPSKNRQVQCDPAFTPKLPIQSSTFYPSGQKYAVVLKAEEPTTGLEFDLVIRVYNQAEDEGVTALLKSTDTLLWQDVLPLQIYCETAESIERKRLRTPGANGDPVGWVYELTAHFIEVERPEA